MALSAIQVALEKHLNTLSPKPAIAWPNVAFTPNANEPYIEVKMRSGFQEDKTIDRTGYMKQDAYFILDVYVPVGTGTLVQRQWLEALEDLFPRDLVLIEGDLEVRLTHRRRNSASKVDTWMVQGLNIRAFAFYR